jgi:hypothetical protein
MVFRVSLSLSTAQIDYIVKVAPIFSLARIKSGVAGQNDVDEQQIKR